MKRTTWLVRIFAVIAAVLVSTVIWAVVDGTAPGIAPKTGVAVTNTNFNQSDNFLTSSSSVPGSSYSPARYRTRAS